MTGPDSWEANGRSIRRQMEGVQLTAAVGALSVECRTGAADLDENETTARCAEPSQTGYARKPSVWKGARQPLMQYEIQEIRPDRAKRNPFPSKGYPPEDAETPANRGLGPLDTLFGKVTESLKNSDQLSAKSTDGNGTHCVAPTSEPPKPNAIPVLSPTSPAPPQEAACFGDRSRGKLFPGWARVPDFSWGYPLLSSGDSTRTGYEKCLVKDEARTVPTARTCHWERSGIRVDTYHECEFGVWSVCVK
ncbi:hypothetical protein DFH07DRAFT_936948 [Mycena maculata]|uniref:Uncharacterized protein n=1 Tax=Mycena maculata TaxID=230809 RepID=A0AAD7NV20_9AGAR|nr:hypothetical protein DFH07DRAFT_936948 [Mycena maculata]